MEPQTKKYLIGAGVLVGGYIIYMRTRHSTKTEVKTPVKKTVAPASTSGQFSPVGLPPAYNPYPAIPYTPSYIPPGPGYIPPYQGGIPGQYYGQYPQPIFGNPYQQYPNQQQQYPGYGGNQAACQSIIGLPVNIARQRLQGLGIYAQVVSINGRPIATTNLATGGPTAQLYVSGSIVQSATCAGGAAYANPVTGYGY